MDAKMRLLCSYGGCVVARPNDGRLRYSGGETRIVVVPRDVSYRNLVSKLKELYDFQSGSGIRLQFQMPDADLDALVCVTCDEEFRHVIDAYLLRDAITDVKIRVFVSVSAPSAQSSKELQFPLDSRIKGSNSAVTVSSCPSSPGTKARRRGQISLKISQPHVAKIGESGANNVSCHSSAPVFHNIRGEVRLKDQSSQFYSDQSPFPISTDSAPPRVSHQVEVRQSREFGINGHAAPLNLDHLCFSKLPDTRKEFPTIVGFHEQSEMKTEKLLAPAKPERGVFESIPYANSSLGIDFSLRQSRGYAAATEQGQLESMRPVSNGQSEISKAPLLSEDRRIRATATIKSELSSKEDKSSGGVSIVSEAELAPKCMKEAGNANLSEMKVLEANCTSSQTKDSFQGYPVSGKNDVPVQPSELSSAPTSCPQASFGIPTVGTHSSSINRNHGNNSQHYSRYPWHLDGLAYHNQQHLPSLYRQDPSVRNSEEKTSSSNRNDQHGRFPSAGDINVDASSISKDNLHGRSPSASNIDVESSSVNRNNEHGRSPSASNIEINASSLNRNYDNGTAGFVFETGLGGQNSQQHVPFLYSAYPRHLDDPTCIYQEHLPSVYFQNPSATNIETEASSMSKNDQYSLSPSTSNSEIEASSNDRNNENGAGGFFFEVGLGGQHSKQYSAYPFHLDGPASLNQHDLPSLYYHNPSYSSTVTDQGQVCILNPQHYRLDGFDSSDRGSQYLPGRQAELFNNKHSWIENSQTHRGVLDHKQNLASHDSSQQLSNNIAAPHQADIQNSLASSQAGSFGNHGNNHYIQGPWAFREQDCRFDYVDRQGIINMSVPNVQAAPESSIPVQLPENLMNQYVIAHQDPVFSGKNSRQVDKSYCEGDNVHLKHSSDTWINQPLMDAPVSEIYQKQAHGHSQDHNIDSSYLNHYDGGFYLLPQHLRQPELALAPDGTKFAADRYLHDQAKDDHFWNLNSRFLSGTHSSDESLVSSMETKCTIEDRDKLDLRNGKFQLDHGNDQFGNDFHGNGVNMFAFSDPENGSGNGYHDYSNLEKRKAMENPVLSHHPLNFGNDSLSGDFNLAASNTGESQTDLIERNDATGSDNLHRIPMEDNSITTSSLTDMQKPSTFQELRAVMAERSSPSYDKDTEGSLATGLPSTESHQQTECSNITQIDSKLNEIKLSKEDIFLEINSRINRLGVGSDKTASSRDSSVNYPSNMFSLAFSICRENGKAIAKNETKEVNSFGYMKNSTEGTLMLDQDNFRETSLNENEGLDMSVNDHSVEKAKNLAIEAEQQALAKGLQTINNADLEEIRELGSGTYGTVYHGRWKGSDVAIKRIKASCFEGSPADRSQLVADFWKEASILSQLHHPNVVSFYGVVRDSPSKTLATVTEYMANGSLKQVLRKKDRTIDLRKRFILAMDAAFGMEYLHGKNIVHFDLKCENLLVNIRDSHRPICKIGDLGLSKVKHQTLVSGGVRGTLPWMAPELLSGDSRMVTDKVDVYSFAIVMWEILTGEEPYANMHCGSIIGGIMTNTLRPTIPTWCEPSWRSLMEKCWSNDPRQRPTFSEISKELRAIAAQQKWC